MGHVCRLRVCALVREHSEFHVLVYTFYIYTQEEYTLNVYERTRISSIILITLHSIRSSKVTCMTCLPNLALLNASQSGVYIPGTADATHTTQTHTRRQLLLIESHCSHTHTNKQHERTGKKTVAFYCPARIVPGLLRCDDCCKLHI